MAWDSGGMGRQFYDQAGGALRVVAGLALLALTGAAPPPLPRVSVVTQHYDAERTGWNAHEAILTPQNVGTPGAFGQTASVALDAEVDAQPLVVPNIVIAGDPNAGKHDVVYVATQGNTIYAIDPTNGTILLSRNFGKPTKHPRGCNNAFSGIGITGTPVIDVGRNAMYFINSIQVGAVQSYVLHQIDLSTLNDKQTPVPVSASETLTDGTPIKFNPLVQRQRPALLKTADNIYAGFGSYCDFNVTARGWVMGWKAGTLQPITRTKSGDPIAQLLNRNATAPNGWFMSSIWMSGSGLAGDGKSVYFVTGNSDPAGTTYDGVNNVPHSVVRLSLSTMTKLDIFTPFDVAALEAADADFGSGGIMLLPPIDATSPPMATAAGKSGIMYLMDRTNLGGFTPNGPDKVLTQAYIGRCVCSQSYFATPTPTIVSSGQAGIILWHIQTTPKYGLTRFGTTGKLPSGIAEDTGMFTSVSSNGSAPGIIWGVARPTSTTDHTVKLMAFSTLPKAGLLPQLFVAPAGQWPAQHTAAAINPVVANGRVYVASDSQLTIFGLLPAPAAK